MLTVLCVLATMTALERAQQQYQETREELIILKTVLEETSKRLESELLGHRETKQQLENERIKHSTTKQNLQAEVDSHRATQDTLEIVQISHRATQESKIKYFSPGKLLLFVLGETKPLNKNSVKSYIGKT